MFASLRTLFITIFTSITSLAKAFGNLTTALETSSEVAVIQAQFFRDESLFDLETKRKEWLQKINSI